MSERTRRRETETEEETIYGRTVEYYQRLRNRVNNPYVVTEENAVAESTMQGELRLYSVPLLEDGVIPDLKMFKHIVPDKSGRHTHQGGYAILALEGEGETLVDDEVVEWEAGDLILLPVKPGGVEHQHFNRNDPDEPAVWLACNYQPHVELIGSLFVQNESADGETMDQNDFVSETFADFDYRDWRDYEPPEETETVYDEFIKRRNLYRKQLATARDKGQWGVIRNDDVDWEWNPQGRIKWFLHPGADDRSVTSLIYSIQEIPPGSRSGKQHRQGGLGHYILEGRGYSVINDERYQWQAGDFVGLPVTPEGNTIQHFNADPDEPARFVRAEPFEHEAVGYDLGCGFEQLEPCPEYEAS